jgi:CubicO group peptidase (beta-lactamase class C family)
MHVATTLVVVLATTTVMMARSPEEAYWPRGADWATIKPAAVDMDEVQLQAVVKYALEQKTLGVLVLRAGKIVAEGYAQGWGVDKTHNLASATKSMTSILVGMALDDGKFKGLDQSIADFAPAWKGTDKEAIQLWHFLSMTTGLNHRGAGLSRRGDQFETGLKMPLTAKPGEVWAYNTNAYHMLFRLLEKATGENLEAYSQRKLFGPLGMEHPGWIKAQAGGVTNYHSVQCSVRDLARFGLFALRGGKWGDKQLVSEQYFRQATSPSQKLNPAYGFLWWLNNPEAAAVSRRVARQLLFPGAPCDLFAAMGNEGQIALIVPSLDLVVVRLGDSPQDGDFPARLLQQVILSFMHHQENK